jgi:hypothetical protein
MAINPTTEGREGPSCNGRLANLGCSVPGPFAGLEEEDAPDEGKEKFFAMCMRM